VGTYYNDSITLLKRTDGSNTNPSRTPSTEIPSGDLKPWRIRMTLTNHGISEFNRGQIILRMDENKTFINTGPILTDENAKNKYIVECKITQSISGSDVTGKTFQFQIKGCSIDVDQQKGSIIILDLVEIQVRLAESVTTTINLFETPNREFMSRLTEFNNFQGVASATSPNVTMLYSSCASDDISTCQGQQKIALPKVDELKQHYQPVGVETYHELLIDCIKRLSNEETVGGVFKDFYFDFENTTATNTMKCFAEEYGGTDSGVVLDPKSIDTIDATETQQASISHVKYKNHVLVKGQSLAGTLPMDMARYRSYFEHAKIRPAWSASTSYIVGNQVKVATYFTGTSITNWTAQPQYVIRYYKCIKDRSANATTPDQDTTYWREDFVNITPFDKYGRYDMDDVVYHISGSTVKFYRAEQSIMGVSLKTLRKSNPVNPDASSLQPTSSSSYWEDLNATGKIDSRSTTEFEGFGTHLTSEVDSSNNPISLSAIPSPWTNNIFDWEKNLLGLKSGSLPMNQGDFMGFAFDWNIARAVYPAGEDYTNSFDKITAKCVDKFNVDDPDDLNAREIFDGVRIIVGTTPDGDFDPNNNAENKYRIAEWVQNPNEGNARWFFSRAPLDNDTVMDMESGRILRYDGSAHGWEVKWSIKTPTPDPTANRTATPFHLVYDIYKQKDSTGLPNQAIEYRYSWQKDNNAIPIFTYGFANRGVWMNMWYPFPRQDTADGNIGYKYGGNGSTSDTKFCMVSTYNDETDSTGNNIGWNNGAISEDMGKISAISFHLKVGFWNANVGDSLNANGTGDAYTGHLKDLEFNAWSNTLPSTTRTITGDHMGNIPMVFWAIDKFDRIWFQRFKIRRNDEWDLITLPFGHMTGGGTKNLYFGKWNRLPQLLGFTITFIDFTLKEKEHSGAGFDWVFVKGWGIFWEKPYDMSLGLYIGGRKAFEEILTTGIEQVVQATINGWRDMGITLANGVNYIIDKVMGTGGGASSGTSTAVVLHHDNALIHWSTIAISNLHFKKDLIVSSNDGQVAGCRTSVVQKGDEFDYVNAKLHAKAKRARASFYPQTWNMVTNGDVRMKFGQSFKVKGDRVPNKDSGEDYITMVCKSVEHKIDHTGYHMTILGQKKFVTTGG